MWPDPPPPGVTPEPVGPGEESVWDFPRPPRVEDVAAEIIVRAGDHVIAQTNSAKRVCETAGAPVYYLPPQDVRTDWMRETEAVSLCEWKGAAVYWDVTPPGGPALPRAAFVYPDPLVDLAEGYAQITGHFGFYATQLTCTVGGVIAQPQPGGLYAGWVLPGLKGPIKGGPGTGGW